MHVVILKPVVGLFGIGSFPGNTTVVDTKKTIQVGKKEVNLLKHLKEGGYVREADKTEITAYDKAVKLESDSKK